MKSEALIVFFKTPEIGKVKTRLAAEIGEEKALLIYQKMLMQVMKTAYEWENGDVNRIVLPFGCGAAQNWPKFGIRGGFQQYGADLGLKMQQAMKFASSQAQKIAIIGTDNPDLSVEEFEMAFQKLYDRDVVFGPCEDGGYYLMACKSLPPTLLWDLPWSSEDTLNRVSARCEGHHLSITSLPIKRDIDTLSDLIELNFVMHLLKDEK